MPRMNIINSMEQEEFNSPPIFKSVQRKKYFEFSSGPHQITKTFRNSTNQVCFLVAFGYFKATKKFFAPQQFRQHDIEYVAKEIGYSGLEILPKKYSKFTRLRHKTKILNFFGFKPFEDEAKSLVRHEVEVMAHMQLRPKLILFKIIDIIIREKYEIPSFFSYQRLFWRQSIQGKKISVKLLKEN